MDKIVYEGAIDNNHLMKVLFWKYFQMGGKSQKQLFNSGSEAGAQDPAWNGVNDQNDSRNSIRGESTFLDMSQLNSLVDERVSEG